MLKNCRSVKEILRKTKLIISFDSSTALLLDESAERIARELWWMNQEIFPCRYHSTMVLHAHISPGRMNNRPIGGCSSEKYSHPTDLIIIMGIIIVIIIIIIIIVILLLLTNWHALAASERLFISVTSLIYRMCNVPG
jgi:hypothetical protein